MIISMVVNGLCSGGNHVNMTATVNGNSYPVGYVKSDFALDTSSFEDSKDAMAILIRSRVKQQAAALGKTVTQMTNLEIKNAIESGVYYL